MLLFTFFQRVCQDKVFPLIYFFAKGGGRSGTEPIRGYFLTLIIAIGCIAIGELQYGKLKTLCHDIRLDCFISRKIQLKWILEVMWHVV